MPALWHEPHKHDRNSVGLAGVLEVVLDIKLNKNITIIIIIINYRTIIYF